MARLTVEKDALTQDPADSDFDRRRQRLVSSSLMRLAQEPPSENENLSQEPLAGGEISRPPESEKPAPLSTEAVPRTPALQLGTPILAPAERLGATVGEAESGELNPEQAIAPFQRMAPRNRSRALMAFFRPPAPSQDETGPDVGGIVKGEALGKVRGTIRKELLNSVEESMTQTGQTVVNPETGEQVSSSSFPDALRNTLFGTNPNAVGLEHGAKTGLEWLDNPESFRSILEQLGWGAESGAELGGEIGSGVWGGAAPGGLGGFFGSGSGAAMAGAPGAAEAGATAAGGFGGVAGGSLATGVAIPLAGLALATMLQGPGKTTDLAGMGKYDPLGIGGILGSLGGSRNKNYTRNFGGNLRTTLQAEQAGMQTLRDELAGSQTQEDALQAIENFKERMRHGEEGGDIIGGYGQGSDPWELPEIPGAGGGKVHELGLRANFGEPMSQLRQLAGFQRGKLPHGGTSLTAQSERIKANNIAKALAEHPERAPQDLIWRGFNDWDWKTPQSSDYGVGGA